MEEGIWILCGILLFVVIFLGFFYVFRKRQVERWKKQSRGDLITKPQGQAPSRFKGIRASFSNASLQIPRGKWRPSGAPEVPVTEADTATPPALKEARRQMAEDHEVVEEQQNEENSIKVDISSVAYSKYKELVYESAYENGFVNVDLNDNESNGSVGESGCVLATPCSTPGSARSETSGAQQLQKWRHHSETEI